jgi:hypothetical protein
MRQAGMGRRDDLDQLAGIHRDQVDAFHKGSDAVVGLVIVAGRLPIDAGRDLPLLVAALGEADWNARLAAGAELGRSGARRRHVPNLIGSLKTLPHERHRLGLRQDI